MFLAKATMLIPIHDYKKIGDTLKGHWNMTNGFIK